MKTSNTVYGAVTLDTAYWGFLGREWYGVMVLVNQGIKREALKKAIETFIIPFLRALEGSRGR
ncbi:hypothetical protein [Thermococcus henrietii]|uniref:hypothetical protein n=1 Tax=Thermococcus henrietii TaxID=2016361 RepID=UPI00131463DA|nr:hypothetical protein [Thermococcus henrietii]